jgi:hypothetical protein
MYCGILAFSFSMFGNLMPNKALQPTATALPVFDCFDFILVLFGFAQHQPRSSWLWLS